VESRTIDRGMGMRATTTVRTNSSGSRAGTSASGVLATRTNMLIGTEFWLHGQICQRRDHAATVLARFARADSAAAANMNAGRPHMCERFQAILVGAYGDDLKFGRAVEIVVVIVEARIFEPARLGGSEHAERGTGFEPRRPDAFDHGANGIEIAILRRAPRCTHAEPAGTARAHGACFGEHRFERDEPFCAHAGSIQSSGQPPVLIESSVEICTAAGSKSCR